MHDMLCEASDLDAVLRPQHTVLLLKAAGHQPRPASGHASPYAQPLATPLCLSCRLVGSPITIEYFPLKPGNKALVDQLWALYLKNGRRHGFHVLSRGDFYRIHLGGTPGLTLMLARVSFWWRRQGSWIPTRVGF